MTAYPLIAFLHIIFSFSFFSIITFASITPPTNRAKLEPFDKTNAGNPHKYRLSAF
jgi:hypothetical protein